MSEFMLWYWSWGKLAFGLIIWLFGIFIGWHLRREICVIKKNLKQGD
jgi:hypothetical protein